MSHSKKWRTSLKTEITELDYLSLIVFEDREILKEYNPNITESKIIDHLNDNETYYVKNMGFMTEEEFFKLVD